MYQPQEDKLLYDITWTWNPAGIQLTETFEVVAGVDMKIATCGSKAANCAELERLASMPNSLFKTPKSCALPFGSMDVALKAAGAYQEYQVAVFVIKPLTTKSPRYYITIT